MVYVYDAVKSVANEKVPVDRFFKGNSSVCTYTCIMNMMCGAHKPNFVSGTNGNRWLEFKVCTSC